MKCILTIDDRPINRQFLVSLLGYAGAFQKPFDSEQLMNAIQRALIK